MYIRAYTGIGDPQPAPARTDWRRRMIPDPPPQPLLVFRRIGPFAVDHPRVVRDATGKSPLTPQLKQQVAQVVDFVRARLHTAQAIGVVRVVGHTDWTGDEKHNIGLGNRRAEAVKDELQLQLRDVLYLVLVEVEKSPGKSDPIGDNRTAKGKAANRRVDVYVGPPFPKAEPWTKPYDWTPPTPPPRPPRIRMPGLRPHTVGGQVRTPVPDGSLRASHQEARNLQDDRRQVDLRWMQGPRGVPRTDRSDDFGRAEESHRRALQRGG